MSNRKIRNFLLVEDNPGDARLLREMLNEQGASDTHLTHVTTMLEAERYIAEHQVDVILLDLGLPDAQGVAGIQRAQAIAPAIPLVVLTGLDDEVLAEQALQEGAQDYLIKGQIETRGILRALRYAVERKRLDQLKNDFVSTVSHELRTPLTSIAGSLGLLIQKMSDDLPVSMHRLLSIAYTNSQRLVRLVNDILDIEKMESGQVVFNFRRVELRALVEQAIEANRGFADAHNVRLRLEDCGEVNAVRADPDRLAQVITNLLSNAIKFSPADREVVASIRDVGDFVQVAVRDHGSGVPIGFRATIFEKFAQADTTNTRQKGGTGLGLSIVKRIVDRLGGTVGFADAPGGGAIFHIELPRWGYVPHALIDQRTQRPIAPVLSSVQRSPRILHINDENAIEQALNKFGDVVSVSSFGAAHIASEASDFDLAVIDAALGTNRNKDAPLCLRDSKGNEIPVIECFARGESLGQGESAQSAPAKSCASIEELVAIVRDRLSTRSAPVPEEAA